MPSNKKGISPLAATTERFLRNPDKVNDWLVITDKHIQSYASNKDLFVLPKQHDFMEPVIKAYAHDLAGFAQYLLELRDNFDKKSRQFVDVQAVYRRVNGRHVQQSRRQRIAKAVKKAEELFGEIAYTKRMQWMAELEHEWARRRRAFLETQRERLKQDRLSTELRTEMLLEFWEIIDTEIFMGELPPWN
jgi:hypothetical protein